jgi:hypothetical protein
VHPNGRPHIQPLLAVWVTDALYFCSGASASKAKNLAQRGRCSLGTETNEFHFVVEGKATKQTDESTLQDVVDEYASKYGWTVEVRDNEFHGDGAPTAGDPPYDVHKLTPETVFGFGLQTSVSSTRWQFA